MNLRTSYKNIFQSPYESQVMQLIGLIGLFRVVVALVQDFRSPVINTSELFTDSAILFVFLIICLLALRLKVTHVPLVFAVVLVTLLAINFLQFGGVTGYTEFNYLIGIVVMVLLYAGQRKNILVICMLLLLAGMLWSVYIKNFIFQLLFIKTQGSPEDFIYSLVSLLILTLYLKYAMDLERDQLLQQQVALHIALDQAQQQQFTLQDQKAQLLAAQEKLEQEVASRTQELENQNASIERYIQYNVTELKEPLTRLKQSLEGVKGSDALTELLRVSVSELETVTNTITHSLEHERTIHKSKIR